jgi:hypothetical protein
MEKRLLLKKFYGQEIKALPFLRASREIQKTRNATKGAIPLWKSVLYSLAPKTTSGKNIFVSAGILPLRTLKPLY